MGTINAGSARAFTGLTATGELEGTNAVGPVTIGGANAVPTAFTDADIFYSFRVTATGSSDVATLTMSTGAIVKTTGTPDVARITGGTSDLAALDFEGVAIPTMVTRYAIMMNRNLSGSDSIEISSGSPGTLEIELETQTADTPMVSPIANIGTLIITFLAAGDWVEVTICGKSS